MMHYIPNLDAMTVDALHNYSRDERETLSRIPRKYAAQRNLYTVAIRYADCKAQAMVLREKGEVERALTLEASCDSLYERIPVAYRW